MGANARPQFACCAEENERPGQRIYDREQRAECEQESLQGRGLS
jgi:hypothetical protein